MGKVENVLKSEITRLARKELRANIEPLQKEVLRLKRTVTRLTRVVGAMDRGTVIEAGKRPLAKKSLETTDDEIKSARITGRVIKNLRRKLGLNQQKLALLLDVSPGAVASWEQDRARPRGKNKTAIVAMRKLGRRDIKRILAEMGSPEESNEDQVKSLETEEN